MIEAMGETLNADTDSCNWENCLMRTFACFIG